MKNCCFVKDPVERIKRQATCWKKILANHVSDRRHTSRVSKRFSNLNIINKATIQLENGQKP